MIKDIKYSGYSAVPSDHECADGELTASINMINEDGALHPICQPGVKFSVGSGMRLFLHKVGSATNYIAYRPDGSLIQWIGFDSPDSLTDPPGKFSQARNIQGFSNVGKIISVAAVGYIIVVSTESNLYYIRYNANKDAYIFLGSKLPEIDLEFALKLNFVVSDTDSKDFEVVSNSSGSGPTTGDGDWSAIVAVSYDVSSAAGSLSRDFNDPGSTSGLISTDFIPFDSAVIFKKGVEYKFKWDVVLPQQGLAIQIWGCRNGSTAREMITGQIASNAASADSYEWAKIIDNDWSNIAYRISFIWSGSVDSANCAARGNLTVYKGVDNSETGSGDVSTYIEYTSDSHTAIMAAVNKFVNEQISEKSRFMYPFFVRYAVQLFDGSYARVSEPILMIPNSGYAPAVSFSKHYSLGTRLVLSAFAADLCYKLRTALSEDWRDIITGVDVFVSLPIWTYNQGQEYDGSKNYFVFRKKPSGQGVGKAYFEELECDSGDTYQKCPLLDYIKRYAGNALTNNYVEIAPRSQAEIMEDIETASDFRKITSLNFEDINNSVDSFTNIKLDKGTVSTIASREALRDDILCYEGYKKAYLKEFNRRIHVCHSSVLLPRPAIPQRCAGYISDGSTLYNFVSVYINLSTEDGVKIVRNHIYKWGGQLSAGTWYFYPDARATKATFVFFRDATVSGLAEVPLKRHTMLNGVYWMADSLLDSMPIDTSVNSDPYADVTVDNSVAAFSTIYVSEANCPFIFKASSAVSVGAQEVVALSNAARALSQGQFGQFPLYAFTTEGIWALSVNEVGTYSAVQPIVRDETIDIDSITQIDAAVLFASSRGIMMLSGSQTQCISDAINSEYPFKITMLPQMDALNKLLHTDNCIHTAAFSVFIRNCQMLYDYPHQRIIIYNSDFTYAYVYSLKSKAWGMMQSHLCHNVNSYPDAYVLDIYGQLLDFSTYGNDTVNGMVITRPLALDLPDVLKTVDTVIQRGLFRKGHVQTVLYGSRDLYNWHLVWSSKDHYLRGFRGTPYKYFRIACVTSLSEDESIYGASVQFTPRLTNQPR